MAKAGEVWAVTGSSKGIGLAYVAQSCRVLEVAGSCAKGTSAVLEAGASAVALVRSPKTSQGLQELLATYGDALTIVAMDVGVFSSIQDAAAAVEQAHPGGIDVLVANAGMGGVSDLSTLNIDLDPAEFDETFHINVTGAFATIKYFYPVLKKKEGGRKTVVTMSSIGGCMGQTASEARELHKPLGVADGIFMAYKASKAALNQVTVQLAQSLKSEGFTLIAMHPGLVETDLAGPLITRIQGAIGEEATANFKLSPEVSVRSQLEYLAGVTQEKDNARFVDYSGKEMPW